LFMKEARNIRHSFFGLPTRRVVPLFGRKLAPHRR